MRLSNALLLIFPVLIAAIITLFVSARGLEVIVTFFVVLDMAISFLMMLLFIDYWRLNKSYEKLILNFSRQSNTSKGRYRLAVVIPVFNEPPDMVAETASASKFTVGDLGDVYVLDDSTDMEMRKKLDSYSKVCGFLVLRRDNRKGYKAGAVNAWLARYGKEYDFLVIMDADQRLIPGVLERILKFFDDPDVAFVQVPQYYSGVDNTIALSAHIQQIPFLRVVMRGRYVKESAFSLGSGTIYRVEHLLMVGGLYEESVTEDIFTSLQLHEKRYKSIYVDLPLVWRGEAPKSLLGYMSLSKTAGL